MRRLAVRLPNWIGDAVMAVPAIRELRRIEAGARLVLIGSPWVSGIFAEQGLADEIRTIPQKGSRLARLAAERALLADCDCVVLLPNSWAAALPAFRAGVRRRCGYRREGRGLLLTHRATPRSRQLGRHQVFYYLDLLQQTGLSEVDYLEEAFTPSIELQADPRVMESAAELLPEKGDGPLIGINPGATYGSAKRWLVSRYAALATRFVRELEATVVLIGSAAERPLAKRIAARAGEPLTILSGRTDLARLMGVLGALDLLVTNDSGPMHLAAALSTPQVALFGSTDEVATGPLDSRAAVIHKHVECSPCLLRECPIDLRCFRRIEVDEVFAAATELLEP